MHALLDWWIGLHRRMPTKNANAICWTCGSGTPGAADSARPTGTKRSSSATPAYIDEYQDTNDLRGAAHARVAAGHLFLRGRRQTEHPTPSGMQSLRCSSGAARRSAPDTPHRDAPQGTDVRIDLNRNFRSTRTLIDCINAVFARAMSREVGGLAYDQAQALQAGLDTDGERCALYCCRPMRRPKTTARAGAAAAAQRH